MAENKTPLLFIVFVIVMIVIGVLNRKISHEIGESGLVTQAAPAAAPAAAVEEKMMEEVLPVAPNQSLEAVSSPETVEAQRIKEKESQEQEAVYELPLREDSLPQ